MKQITVTQGSPEWLAHRTRCWNASDAPAMMGVSPYKTRDALLRELATGIAPEVGAQTQRLFDAGHRIEALARPLAEQIIGEELFPVTATHDDLTIAGRPVAASLDGVTLMEDVVWECKSLNADLRAAFADMQTIAPEHRELASGKCLPLLYRVQMEQQLLVSGADRVLFSAARLADDDTLADHLHCWYLPDHDLRAKIVAGWTQFAADLAAYKPAETAPAVVAASVQSLPAVTVRVDGQLTVADNFKAFELALREFLDRRLIRHPQTDQDFADLDAQIKTMKQAEAALDAAEAQMLAQVSAVDQAKRAKDMLAKMVRDNRLMAEKLLASEKERRRMEIVTAAREELTAHIQALDARLGNGLKVPHTAPDFAASIKGLRSLDSMQAALNTAVANAKIETSATADRMQVNLEYLRQHASEYRSLFADTATIITKQPDDLAALVQSRIAQHQAEMQRMAEAAAERERERIRREEAARIERETAQKLAAERAAAEAAERAAMEAAKPAPPIVQTQAPAPVAAPSPVVVPIRQPVTDEAYIKLGDINAALAPLSITAEGLLRLGFAHRKTDKAAKLYAASDMQPMFEAIREHITKTMGRALAMRA